MNEEQKPTPPMRDMKRQAERIGVVRNEMSDLQRQSVLRWIAIWEPEMFDVAMAEYSDEWDVPDADEWPDRI
jgi:hypothetical protein